MNRTFIDDRYKPPVRVEMHFTHYHDGNTALRLIVAETGEPWAMASVNIEDNDWADLYEHRYQYIPIKNWSEGTGMDEVLRKVGVINGEPVLFVRSGFVLIPIYALSVDAIEMMKEDFSNGN